MKGFFRPPPSERRRVEAEYCGLMTMGSALAGGIGVFLVFRGETAIAVAFHAMAALLGGRAAVISDGRRLGSHFFQNAVAFCLPFFGGVISFLLAESIKRKKIGRLSEEFAVYLNDAATFRESVSAAEAEVPPSEDLVSLADILASPVSEAEQRIAVENLAGMETPDAIGILRQVAESDTGEGRLFAMTALGQIEERLLGKLLRLEERLRAEEGTAPPETLVETARAYIDFSYFRLVQDTRSNEYLVRAGELLERAAAYAETEDDARILLGRVRLMQYDGEGARACFDAYLAKKPDNQAGFLWRAEANYMLGRCAEVREDCLRAHRLGPIPANIRASTDFWLSGLEGENA